MCTCDRRRAAAPGGECLSWHGRRVKGAARQGISHRCSADEPTVEHRESPLRGQLRDRARPFRGRQSTRSGRQCEHNGDLRLRPRTGHCPLTIFSIQQWSLRRLRR